MAYRQAATGKSKAGHRRTVRLARVNLLQSVVQTAKRVYKDDVSGLAAELSYRFFLALFPFFIFLAALGSFIAAQLPVSNPAQRIVDTIGAALPLDVASVLQTQLQHVIEVHSTGLLSVGIVGTLLAASSGFNSLFKALNRAYEVEETRSIWKRYLIALGLTLLSGSLLVGAFILVVVGQIFGQRILQAAGAGADWATIVMVARWLAAVLLLCGAVTLLYWAAPDMDLRLVWTLPGTLLFVTGWTGGTYLFAFYLGHFATFDATYGTLGSAAILLIWFYFSSMILLAGAELNAVIDQQVDPEGVARRREHTRVRAAQNAIASSEVKRRGPAAAERSPLPGRARAAGVKHRKPAAARSGVGTLVRTVFGRPIVGHRRVHHH